MKRFKKLRNINIYYVIAVIGLALIVLAVSFKNAGATNNNQCNRNNPENCPDPIEICENGQATGNPHCQSPSPTATSSPAPTESPVPSEEPTASPSASPVASETPRPVQAKDSPEKSDPCYYLSYTPECQAKYTPGPDVVWK